MKRITRREFLRSSAAAGTGLTIFAPYLRAQGANNDVRIAVAGINGRGNGHIDELIKTAGVRMVALCDVDKNVLARRAKALANKNIKVETYVDFRKLLENKDIDAVSIATPNHWHSLMTVWTCQAGKDVYVEKPCSHNIFEGRKCVEAARKYRRIVQHGTQNRASKSWAKAVAAVHSGKYGKLLVSKGYCCKPRWSIGFKPFKDVPEHLDFDMWLGPAPQQKYHENLVHYNWHWFWDFGNGDSGNQGVHQIDIARWAIKESTLPKSVVSMGGRWVDGPDFKDQGETPNMEMSVFDFDGTLLVFETRGLVGKTDRFPNKADGEKYPNKVDNEFYLEQGVIRNGKFYPGGKGNGEELGDVDFKLHPGSHFKNFIDCMRSRKQDELNAEILEGHLSSALCHLGNISYRLGSEEPFKGEMTAMGQSMEISNSVMAILENTKAIGVDPAKLNCRVGPKLKFDPGAEKFVDNETANAMLARPYRAPFVVPEQV